MLHRIEIALIDRGKGQPMRTKKLGNGGPTMRRRAILTGGG